MNDLERARQSLLSLDEPGLLELACGANLASRNGVMDPRKICFSVNGTAFSPSRSKGNHDVDSK